MSAWSKGRCNTMGLISGILVLTLCMLLQFADSQLCNGVTTGAIPHPTDCTKYISCTTTGSSETSCPTGQYFDTKMNACLFPSSTSVCPHGNLTSLITSAQPNYCELNHWIDGIHPHPQTCKVYIHCQDSTPQYINCSAGELFDPNEHKCVSQDKARPCNDAPVNVNVVSICISARADILFILDASSSMSYQDFALQRRFISNITGSFPVGGNDVHFSVMVFSNDAQIKIPFSAQQTNANLASSIENIAYVGSSTYTHLALDLARTTGFTVSNGARSDTKKIAIVLTDGLSDNTVLTLSSANQLKQSGVHVFAVGVGHFDRTELNGIATAKEDVFFTDNFDLLHELERELTSQLCNGAMDPFCANNSYADVIIVMDSSNSIGYNNWMKQLDFAASLTSNFKIGPQDMRFAAISYGTVVHKLFDLHTYPLASMIGSAIKQATYLAESTNTAAALRSITEQGMFRNGSGGRSDATKIVIVMTDGQSNNPADTQAAASNLMANGIHIIAIGIGDAVDFREIVAMSSTPADRFHSPGYDVLYRLEEEVKNRTCHIQEQGPGQDVSNFCLQQNWVNGIHAYPFDCTKFIECTFLHTAIMHCPPNLVYDPILQTCTYPKDAVSCLDHNDYHYLPGQSTPVPHVIAPLDVSTVCLTNHWVNGIYPHPTDCSFYLECRDGVTIKIACQPGTVFDPLFKGCNNINNANPCNDIKSTQAPYTTQRFATTTSPRYDLINVCSLYTLPDGIYPDPGSCVHFIECTNEDTKHMKCPEGLEFNSKSLYCDDVHNINCNDNYNFQFEHIVAG